MTYVGTETAWLDVGELDVPARSRSAMVRSEHL
jgi:hypothetical protein